MDKPLNEARTLTVLEHQLQRRDIQIFKHNLAKLIEAAQPKPEESPQDKPLPKE